MKIYADLAGFAAAAGSAPARAAETVVRYLV